MRTMCNHLYMTNGTIGTLLTAIHSNGWMKWSKKDTVWARMKKSLWARREGGVTEICDVVWLAAKPLLFQSALKSVNLSILQPFKQILVPSKCCCWKIGRKPNAKDEHHHMKGAHRRCAKSGLFSTTCVHRS